jgi:hypothetical protein
VLAVLTQATDLSSALKRRSNAIQKAANFCKEGQEKKATRRVVD